MFILMNHKAIQRITTPEAPLADEGWSDWRWSGGYRRFENEVVYSVRTVLYLKWMKNYGVL